MYGIDRKRYFWVCVSALLQGLFIGKYSVTESGLFLLLPLSLVVIVPFALWLAQEHWGRRLRRFLGVLSLFLFVFYAYWIWAVFPTEGEIHYLPTQTLNLVRLCATVFFFLPFFQCRIATWSWRVPYSEVFFQLCRNMFLLFQAIIVTVVFWALLLTASLLFDIIGLGFVPQALFNPYVAFPLTSLTIALSITLALKHPGIDSLGRWILSILAWLLPPFSVISVVFVASLTFSGLQTLWDRGQASTLMLWLQFATLLLANAAWLDGTRSPFSNKTVDSVAKFSLLCLPVYTALCLYSLGLRIQQYGWSVDRIHAAFFVVMAGIWGLGYAGIVLLRQWPSAIGRVNTVAALVLAVIVIAMNSPLLDPYRLSANNQVDRLLEGKTKPENFDFLYLRFNLGRYGNYALNRLNNAKNLSNADTIHKHLTSALTVNAREHWTNLRNDLISEKKRREILDGVRIFPEGRSLPPDILEGWEVIFTYKDVNTERDGEELLTLCNGTEAMFDVSSPDLKLVGVFYGDINSMLPLSEDVKVNGQRYRILPVNP